MIDGRTDGRTAPRRAWALAAALLLACAWPGAARAQSGDALVVGPDDAQFGCRKCHEREVEAWEETHHFRSLEVLDDSAEADDILANLGLDSFGSETALCQTCHVTTWRESADDEAWPEWGVSCESCHGAAEHWVDIHQQYGQDADGNTIKAADRALEPAEHRAERIAAAEAAGMIRPERTWTLASNCLGCHTVPQQELVDVGGHTAGSAEFELLAWSQGEVRHGFLHGAPNDEATPERKRELWLVGQLADLRRSLEALAGATSDGPFRDAMLARVAATRAALASAKEALGGGAAADGLGGLLDALPDELPAVGDGSTTALATTAARAGESIAALCADGADLAALDGLLPTDVRGDAARP